MSSLGNILPCLQVCDDYLMFRGEKTALCGRGDGRNITLPATGPAGFTFSSNNQAVDMVRSVHSKASLVILVIVSNHPSV